MEETEITETLSNQSAMAAGKEEETKAAASSKVGKMRMPQEDIDFILALRREPIPEEEDLGSVAHHYTAEELEERRREHLELVEVCRQTDDEIEERQAQIRRELAEKGYVEVDDDYLARQEEADEWARKEWESLVGSSKRLRFLRVAAPDHPDGEVLLGSLYGLDMTQPDDLYGLDMTQHDDDDDDDDPTDEDGEVLHGSLLGLDLGEEDKDDDDDDDDPTDEVLLGSLLSLDMQEDDDDVDDPTDASTSN